MQPMRTRKFALMAAALLLAAHASASDLPDAARTPGAINHDVTQENIRSTICVKNYTKTIRPPANYTNRLKKEQIREYGYDDRNPRDYEEDHLVPLEVGGNPRDPHNLWPEPKKTEWGAEKKDHLENTLHRMVCNGDISLKDAQDAFMDNWIEAYKQYVHDHDGSRKHSRKHKRHSA